MQKAFMRIPYTGPLPSPLIIPNTANTVPGAIAALTRFLSAPPSPALQRPPNGNQDRQASTVLLTGAGISVASGLADYRGTNGTYTLNKTYRPIYFSEFVHNHEARKRYWARSFLGWPVLERSKPNAAHRAVQTLGERGWFSGVVTQSKCFHVDSFHLQAHPSLPTLELHGYLRSLVCLTCGTHLPRSKFQESLAALNPAWATFLAEALASGALDTEHPDERRRRGLRANPDGDVDLPNAPYSSFRYPACPTCLAQSQRHQHSASSKPASTMTETNPHIVNVDPDGAYLPTSTAGILKPAVVMFGESIAPAVKTTAEDLIDSASRLLVVGSSLATYSAWRLAKRARDRGMPIGVLNLGGVRGEEALFEGVGRDVGENTGENGVRCSQSADVVLAGVVANLKGRNAAVDETASAGPSSVGALAVEIKSQAA
ncbi:MAG: hypothetical protein M1819_003117 [Sarea resinae]|nr:MAG: hypothetical protein M1819_003117 [Sarea resinae]